MSHRSFMALCGFIVGGFFLFGWVNSKPPWDPQSIYLRLTSPPPRMEWPTQEPVDAPIERVVAYVPNYSQILNYTVTSDAVYASVRAGSKSALVAWRKDGTLLWDETLYNGEGKTTVNFFDYGRNLAVAGPHLIVSYSDGRAGGKNAMLWVNRRTGKTTNRLWLEGRLYALAYYPKVQLIITIVNVPDDTLVEGRKLGRMDVVAFSNDGREVWRRRLPTHDAQPLRFDGDVVVLTNTPPYYPHERSPNTGAVYVKRLDPATGADLWSMSPAVDFMLTPTATPEASPAKAPQNVSIYFRGHILLYSIENGQNIWNWQIPATLTGLPMLLDGDSRHLYVTRDAQQAGSPGAIEYPSGKVTWSDTSVEAYYTQPVIWGNRAVYLVWPANAPRTGILPFARLYIRTAKDTYLFTEKQFALRSNDPPQVHDGLLYSVNGYNIESYRWLGQ